MDSKTIVILGAGIGGIVAASLLRKALPRAHRVVLVEREERHVFQPSLLWLMTGSRTPENISRPVDALKKRGIELVRGDIERIDPARRAVQVNGTELTGDYLVIALGAELAPETIPGLSEAGHNFYSLAGAQALRDARLRLNEGKLVVLVGGVPFKCPAAPYEAAMLLESDLRRRGLRERVSVAIYSPEPGPMGTAGPEVSAMLRQMVESKDIAYYPEHVVTKVDSQERQIYFTNNATVKFDLLAYVPPHRAPQAVRDAGLCGESGWVPVNRFNLETKFPGVYAIGDVTGIALAIGKPLPKAGVFAHKEAEVVAHNIACAITGQGEVQTFEGYGECFVEIGDGRAGFGSGNFYAEPKPQVALHPPSRWRHWGKIAYEKYWLFKWF
ncbi:MAG: NAD(P)/FAD-dependent oxidoreductase [Sulfuricaulis sp.]|uniref:NAD(P)/FAD-dependent oxidoreductase n=1 Tax=Sulfuricaulis sp. TaxID=2003553 RepID=UPI0025DE269A|nr:FAD/NAD(P)-binding oxidoreductase [Sulfuricaulis sp.]MCR4347776.1 NAD(P)/FAD-dependent oxidoreductase [Sulfuricaulis sp.]